MVSDNPQQNGMVASKNGIASIFLIIFPYLHDTDKSKQMKNIQWFSKFTSKNDPVLNIAGQILLNLFTVFSFVEKEKQPNMRHTKKRKFQYAW